MHRERLARFGCSACILMVFFVVQACMAGVSSAQPRAATDVPTIRRLYMAGRFDEVVTMATPIIEANPIAGDVLALRGAARYRLGRTEEAQLSYELLTAAD